MKDYPTFTKTQVAGASPFVTWHQLKPMSGIMIVSFPVERIVEAGTVISLYPHRTIIDGNVSRKSTHSARIKPDLV